MNDRGEKGALSALISDRAAELRVAWRAAAHFDDVAAMHISGHGEQMLLSLSARIDSGSSESLRQLMSSPPWTGNKGEADAPLSLLVALEATLNKAIGDRPEMRSAAEKLVADLAAAIDSVQRDKVRRLEERIATDPLTGAMSRLAVMEHLETECSRASRYGRPLSVVYLDVDGLKSTNDELGHRAGDDLLRKLTECVAANTRAADLFGRLSGDEFLLVLPETDLAGASAVAEKLSRVLAEESLHATCGTAGTPGTTPEPAELVEAADASMRALKARRA